MAESKPHNLTSRQMRDKLNGISPSFCAAKWLQVTMHLQTGFTHSCHHPIPHKIPLDEIKNNPSALHNTLFKKKQREMMLRGERPSECDFCWNIEDAPGDNLSDRAHKSNEDWAAPNLEEIKNLAPEENINPTYLEVSFSNACNFKCAYCSPDISSKWFEEIKQFGSYPTSQNFNSFDNYKLIDKMPYAPDEPNPYIDAFWLWWPEVCQSLKVFRITGGEPLLARSTFRVFEHLEANPNLNLDFAINSNLGVPVGLIDKMATHAENLLGLGPDRTRKVKSFTLFTSVDTYGAQSEYIRTGQKYDEFVRNVESLLKRIPSLQIVIMCTTNALSVTGFKGLLTEVARIKQEFYDERRYGPALTIDISYLRLPSFLSIKILPDSYIRYFEQSLSLMLELSEEKLGVNRGFSEHEISKMRRLIDYMGVPTQARWLGTMRTDFFMFINEYDRRRGLDFNKAFPEMSEFFGLCKTARAQIFLGLAP